MVMDQKTNETDKEAARLLAALTPRERRLVESTVANHPGLTVAEAIDYLREVGM